MKNGQVQTFVMSAEQMHELKIALLGKVSSGKSSLAIRFISNIFSCQGQYKATIGVAYASRKVEYDNKKFRLQIWDTAGCERFEALSRAYYRGAKAAIICHELTDLQSYQRAVRWAEELSQQEPTCMIYLCGTKKDLVLDNPNLRAVSQTKVLKFANSVKAKVIETSSKSGEGVRDVFLQIVKDYSNQINSTSKQEPDSIRLRNQTPAKFRCVCKNL